MLTQPNPNTLSIGEHTRLPKWYLYRLQPFKITQKLVKMQEDNKNNDLFSDNHDFNFKQEPENAEIEQTGLEKMIAIYDINHKEIADNLVSVLERGEINPIQLHLSLKRMEKVIELVKDNNTTKDIITNYVKAQLGGNAKTVEQYGAKLSVAATYTWYDFSKCNDIYLDELYKIQNDIKELIKNRETELKLLIPNTNDLRIPTATKVIDRMPSLEWTELGQDCVVTAPIKYQKEGVKVTFNKQ